MDSPGMVGTELRRQTWLQDEAFVFWLEQVLQKASQVKNDLKWTYSVFSGMPNIMPGASWPLNTEVY